MWLVEAMAALLARRDSPSVAPAAESIATLAELESFIWRGGLRDLARLELSGRRYAGARFAHALAVAGTAGALRVLSLAGNPLGDDGARALADAPWLAGLEALDLSRARLTSRAAWALAAAPLARLRRLALKRNRLDAAGAAALAATDFAALE